MADKKKPSRILLAPVNGYDAMLSGVVELLEQARRTSARAVNAIMTATYWETGRRIVEHEQKGAVRAEYGSALLKRLSADLTAKFGRGFSERNLNQKNPSPSQFGRRCLPNSDIKKLPLASSFRARARIEMTNAIMPVSFASERRTFAPRRIRTWQVGKSVDAGAAGVSYSEIPNNWKGGWQNATNHRPWQKH